MPLFLILHSWIPSGQTLYINMLPFPNFHVSEKLRYFLPKARLHLHSKYCTLTEHRGNGVISRKTSKAQFGFTGLRNCLFGHDEVIAFDLMYQVLLLVQGLIYCCF